ncbi:hypothetical protein ACJRO7_004738 [Eucalyptus globulus]|uniref:Uncharacterized protein n=1 Tax=Eucalyptus globulus TaxID=34317 RepID=A0ABD3IXY4_EUCGL
MNGPPNPPPVHPLHHIMAAIDHLRHSPWLIRIQQQHPDPRPRQFLERFFLVMDNILSYVDRHQLLPATVHRHIGADQLQPLEHRQYMDLLNVHQHHLREFFNQLRRFINPLRRCFLRLPRERFARHRQDVDLLYQFTYNIFLAKHGDL